VVQVVVGVYVDVEVGVRVYEGVTVGISDAVAEMIEGSGLKVTIWSGSVAVKISVTVGVIVDGLGRRAMAIHPRQ